MSSSHRSLGTRFPSMSVSTVLADHRSIEFSYEELAAATHNFNLSHKIGQGGFASVYFGLINGQVCSPFVSSCDRLTRMDWAYLVVILHEHQASSLSGWDPSPPCNWCGFHSPTSHANVTCQVVLRIIVEVTRSTSHLKSCRSGIQTGSVN